MKKSDIKSKKNNKKIWNIIRYVLGSMFIFGAIASLTVSVNTYLFFALIAGITLLPCLYEFLRKKINKGDDKIWLCTQIILPLVFIILFGMFTPVDIVIVQSTGNCEYVKQFDIKNGSVYFYCLDKIEIRQDDDTYLLLEDMYNKDVNTIDILISKQEAKNEYEDGSILYNDGHYSILKCANGDLVFGNSYMGFRDGFCGVNMPPSIKEENNSSQDNDNKENSNQNQEYSNLKNITNKTLKNNFIIACKQSNIKVEEIKNLKKVDDWNNGPRYTFTYKSNALILYALDNGTVSSITITNKNLDKVYLDGFEALNVENFLIDLSDIASMQVKAEESIKTVLKHPSTADFKWVTTGAYGRSYDIYTISGKLDAKNSFGVESESTFYIEMTRQNGNFNVVYMLVDGKKYIGSKSQIKEIERKEIITEEENESNDIILKDGKKGNYGKEDLFDGEKYIRYYVPTGTYEVEALVKNASFFIETKKIYKDDNGYDTSDIIERVSLANVGDKKVITITNEGCISLVIHTQVKLIPKK